jgi:hypothetical protein
MTSWLLHVGYPKTGTSALQRHFFPVVADRQLTRANQGAYRTAAFKPLAESAMLDNDSDYREDELRQFFEDASRDASQVVLSDEGFIGDMWDDGRDGDRSAERLHRLLPDAQVLISVRRQDEMARSLYAQYVHKGGHIGFADFINNRAPGWNFGEELLCYDKRVRHYQDLFGTDRVLVLPYERLVADAGRFLAQVLAHMGVDRAFDASQLASENRSLSPLAQRALRYSNRLFRASRFNDHPSFGNHTRAHDVRFFLQRHETRLLGWHKRRPSALPLPERLQRCYAESNVRLIERTGLPLAELGYPVASALPTSHVQHR